MSNSTSTELIVSLHNPAFCVYLISACLLILKMMSVTLLTIFYRVKHKIFISSEDAKYFDGEVAVDDTIERVRRAHLNDLENIPIFMIAALAYLWTEPPTWVACLLFLGFTLIRTLHTIAYCLVLPQPTRAMFWTIGFLLTGYLAIHSALHAFIYLVQ